MAEGQGASWLDEISEAVKDANERASEERAERQAKDRQLAAEFDANRQHLEDVIKPVLEMAAAKMTDLGRKAEVSQPHARLAGSGEVDQALRVEGEGNHELRFATSRRRPGIRVQATCGFLRDDEQLTRDDLTTERVQDRVKQFVRAALDKSYRTLE